MIRLWLLNLGLVCNLQYRIAILIRFLEVLELLVLVIEVPSHLRAIGILHCPLLALLDLCLLKLVREDHSFSFLAKEISPFLLIYLSFQGFFLILPNSIQFSPSQLSRLTFLLISFVDFS